MPAALPKQIAVIFYADQTTSSALLIAAGPAHSLPTGTKSRESLYGASIRLARIGMMQAINRHLVKEFDTSRKPYQWGKRELKREE